LNVNAADTEIATLRARLQNDLLALRGEVAAAPAPRFRTQLLLPLALVAVAGFLVATHPGTRKRALLGLALRAGAAVLG
jgi:hypothetical protein